MKKENIYLLNKLTDLNEKTSGLIFDKLNKTAQSVIGADILNKDYIIDINKIIEILNPKDIDKAKVDDITF
jgi:hypothetical protein